MENYWDLLLLKELEVVLALEVVPALEVDLASEDLLQVVLAQEVVLALEADLLYNVSHLAKVVVGVHLGEPVDPFLLAGVEFVEDRFEIV